MIEFLDHILPEEGWRCATTITNKRAANNFFQTNAELTAFITQQDAQGVTVYHACASYKTPGSRKASNVQAVKCLWMDIDGGQDAATKRTGYVDLRTALHACGDFYRTSHLPPPTVVASGTGLHVYWVFHSALLPDRWKDYADALKRAAVSFGLFFDPARTADAASILRSPGTTNRKRHTAVSVQAGPLLGPYEIERFNGLQDNTPAAEERSALSLDASYLAYRAPVVASASLANLGSESPRYSALIADRCAQVGRMRGTLGRLSEPLWYANIGVLVFADDGEQSVHDWSKGDDRYTAEETNRKIAQARRLTGATTCARFESLEPSLCQACPHYGKITSPISLGYDEGRADQLGATPSGQSQALTQLEGLPRLPPDFDWQGEALFFIQGTPQGPRYELISKYPLYLLRVNKGEVRGEFSLTFRFKIPSEGWKLITVNSKELFGPHGLGTLNDHGVNIHTAEHFRRYVQSAIDHYYEFQLLAMRYDQYGWKEAGFLYGSKLYTAQGEHDAALSAELEIRNQWVGPGAFAKHNPKTGIERWKAAANMLFASGCEAQSIAMLASGSAPIMRYAAEDEGGTIVSLVNRESAKGKSTGLIGAASIWGVKEGLGLQNSDNRVTKFLTLGALGNLPLFYDEIKTKDPVFIYDFIENFTVGRDKMRATREGQIRHSASTWQTVMLCASNASLVDALAVNAHSGDTPMAMRVLELEAELPEDMRNEYGEDLRITLRQNSGYAGELYVRYLVQIQHLLPQLVQEAMQHARKRTGWHRQYRFWIRLIACMSVTGVIFRKIGLLDFSTDRIVKWLIETLSERIDDSKAHVNGVELPLEWATLELGKFVSSILPQTLIVPQPYAKNRVQRPVQTPRDRMSARYELVGRRMLATHEILREYAVSKSIPWHEWRKALEKAGVMSEQKKSTLTAGTELPGGQLYVHEINLNHVLMAGVEVPVEESNVVQLRNGE